jgi:hypothetical protein
VHGIMFNKKKTRYFQVFSGPGNGVKKVLSHEQRQNKVSGNSKKKISPDHLG